LTASAAGYTSATQSSTVTAGATTTTNFTLTATPGTITGKVSDSAGTGISGASVSYSGGSATTDTNGNYTLASVAPGTYSVTASAPGYNSSTSTVAVNAGSRSTLNFGLTVQTGNIHGTVTNSSGKAIGGATVTIHGGLVPTTVNTTTTGPNGTYSSGVIPVGDYTVTVQKGAKSQTQSGTVTSNTTSIMNFVLQ